LTHHTEVSTTFFTHSPNNEKEVSVHGRRRLRFLSFLLQIVGVWSVCRLFRWDVLLLSADYCAQKPSQMGS